MRSVRIEGSAPRLIVFHGTGGDEHNLIGLARTIAPARAIVSYRGIVEENGMLRWFPRRGPNVFVESEVREHIDRIMAGLRAEFSDDDLASSVFLGYSNGANAIASMLQRGLPIRRAALLHPMLVLSDECVLDGVDVFVSAGEHDVMIPPVESDRLVGFFERAGASVSYHRFAGGHAISRAEVDALAAWFTGRSDPR